MTNLKIVYFDSVGIDPVAFEGRLRNICKSIYIIKEGLLLVDYDGSSKKMFGELFPNDALGNVFIADLDTALNSYWGFMPKDIWTWLNDKK